MASGISNKRIAISIQILHRRLDAIGVALRRLSTDLKLLELAKKTPKKGRARTC